VRAIAVGATRSFQIDGAPPVGLLLALPQTVTARTRLVVVMHGVLRNAADYLADWREWAASRGHVVACPCFEREHWPRGSSYNLGAVTTRGRGRGRPRPAAARGFTVVEHLAALLRRELDLADAAFDLWGHSAGAQFVHRFPLFRPDAPVRRIVAAGAGWYTAPDLHVDYPHGLRHEAFDFDRSALERWTQRDLLLLRGELDLDRDLHLRCDAATDSQGPTRWHRASHMLDRARAADPATRWRLLDVARAPRSHHHGPRDPTPLGHRRIAVAKRLLTHRSWSSHAAGQVFGACKRPT